MVFMLESEIKMSLVLLRDNIHSSIPLIIAEPILKRTVSWSCKNVKRVTCDEKKSTFGRTVKCRILATTASTPN